MFDRGSTRAYTRSHDETARSRFSHAVSTPNWNSLGCPANLFLLPYPFSMEAQTNNSRPTGTVSASLSPGRLRGRIPSQVEASAAGSLQTPSPLSRSPTWCSFPARSGYSGRRDGASEWVTHAIVVKPQTSACLLLCYISGLRVFEWAHRGWPAAGAAVTRASPRSIWQSLAVWRVSCGQLQGLP